MIFFLKYFDFLVDNIIHTHICGTIIIIIRKLALTETLEQITQEYRREHDQGKKLIITKDNTLKQIRNTQEDTGTLNLITYQIISNHIKAPILNNDYIIIAKIVYMIKKLCNDIIIVSRKIRITK